MKTSFCQHCGGEFEKKMIGTHVASCTESPTYEKDKEAKKKKLSKSISSYYKHKLGVKKWFTKVCKKCGKKYDVFCYEHNLSNPEEVKQHCSYSCSNSRTQTEEINIKRKNTFSKKREGMKTDISYVKCEKCGYTRIHSNKRKIRCPMCRIVKKEKEKSRVKRKKTPAIKNRSCSICGNSIIGKATKTCSKDCWKQLVSIMKKELVKSGKFKLTGGTTEWVVYKNGLCVQGSYELRVCHILDEMLKYKEILGWEYTKDRFVYFKKDKTEHTYRPDFKIIKPDNAFTYIEVKGFEREYDRVKWEAVKQKGNNIEVWFIKEIRKLEYEYGLS